MQSHLFLNQSTHLFAVLHGTLLGKMTENAKLTVNTMKAVLKTPTQPLPNLGLKLVVAQ
jgi:hypothetical protein